MILGTGDRNESKRFAAVCVLSALTKNAPTLIYSYIPQILDLIWIALRDTKVNIREGAAEALNSCLALAQARENTQRRSWYKKIFEEIQKGLKLSSSDAIHGSLLALREILNSSPKYIDVSFGEICEIVLRYKEHR